MEEAKKWLEKAKMNLKVAQDNFNLKHYDYSAFLCQQTAEKALKSVALKKTGKIRKIHDAKEVLKWTERSL